MKEKMKAFGMEVEDYPMTPIINLNSKAKTKPMIDSLAKLSEKK
jgi:hypothetical protein